LKHAYITELAESDLDKIWLHIARDNPDAADRLVEQLRAICETLAASPELGKPRPEFAAGLRSYRAGNRFIFYFETASGIEIARVLHGARDLPRLF
jgi:toxin ParE1/3/4